MSEQLVIEHRELRSAIEFAVAMGEELSKRKRSAVVPRELRSHFGKPRIPTAALGRLRRAIEQNDNFRQVVAAGALSELVDPVGILWLQRPPGWQEEAQRLIAGAAASEEETDLRVAVRREEKRRRAAEQATARAQADLVLQRSTIESLEMELDVLRADLVKADDAIAELRAELVDVRNEARHARDRAVAAAKRLDAERAGRVTEHRSLPAESAPAPPIDEPSVDLAELAELAQAARAIVERVEAIATPAETVTVAASPRREPRRRLELPGGIIASSSAAAEHLLRSDAAVLVDGYNVAKLGWPTRHLEAQRTTLLDGLENVARRFGTDITVVFDGSSVIGAHTTRRRLLRVVYSPDGVIADDVIRDEVRRLPASRPVVVVTNDAEIVADVRALGANVVPSNALLAVL